MPFYTYATRWSPLLAALVLGGCITATTLANHPLRIACKGEASVNIVGSGGPSAGINGSITARCPETGAEVEWGPPTTTPATPVTTP